MQTFMPYPSRRKSAYVLDNKRLNKQITEVFQIYNCLKVKSNRWKNHPAVLMWKNYEPALLMYGLGCYDEWVTRFDRGLRGGKREHKSGDKIIAILEMIKKQDEYYSNPPVWIFNKDLNRSHQSNLVRKDPEYYRKFFPTVPDNLPYLWPTKQLSNATTAETRIGNNN